MDYFEQEARRKLKSLSSADKIYLKKNYIQEIMVKHQVSDELIDLIFNPKKIIGIHQNIAYADRIDILIQMEKNKRLKVIIQLDPSVGNQKCFGKVGIITAFFT